MWRRALKGRPTQTSCKASKIASIVNNALHFKTSKEDTKDLSSNDIIIAVMGPTGSGKSSFIEMVTGATGLVGHGLASFTTEISVIRLSYPELHLCFVDTPGFDDTHKSDVDIFKMISNWLNETYQREIRLNGLLYFHRISDTRMAGTPLRNLRMFEKLCGEEFNGIVLTTTMWNEVDEGLGTERESELKDEYWKSMIERGSSVKRFLNSRQSAFEVLAPILEEVDKRSALLLQVEMNDLRLQLSETSAGKTLSIQLAEVMAHHQDVLGRVREELKDPALNDDPAQFQFLVEEYRRVSMQLQCASGDLQRISKRKS